MSFVDTCTDLGVTYNRALSYTPHINNITAKASLRAKLILKCFQTRDASILMKAFVTFVRPILEYASAVWNPHFKYDIDKVEAVQRRFTKKLAGYYKLPYAHRLAQLSIDSLQKRRIRTDLMLCFKMLHGLVDVNISSFFTLSDVLYTRGNSKKLAKPCSVSVRDANLFSKRIVKIWNSLPENVVSASSFNSFKSRLASVHLPVLSY